MRQRLADLFSPGLSPEAQGRFYAGVMGGFIDGLKGWLEVAKLGWDASVGVGQLLWSQTPSGRLSGAVTQSVFGRDPIEETAEASRARLKEIGRQVMESLFVAKEICGLLGQETPAILTTWLKTPPLSGLALEQVWFGPEYVVDKYFGELIDTLDPLLAEIAAELIEAVDDPYPRGTIVGQMLYEASDVLVTAGAAKLAKGPKYAMLIGKLGEARLPGRQAEDIMTTGPDRSGSK